MKKYAFALIVIAVSIGAIGATADAYPPDYPPTTGTITIEPAAPMPGDIFTATFTGCVGDETVSFGFSGGDGLREASCEAGRASVQFEAPELPGTYSIGVFAFESRATGVLTVEIVGEDLPITGSGGSSTLLVIAVGLLAVGGGLVGTSQLRRHRSVREQ